MLPDRTNPTFPEALKAAREAAGLTKGRLARMVGLSSAQIARYEDKSGGQFSRPRPYNWLKLNEALGRNGPAAASHWRETVRDIFDTLHFGEDNCFTGSRLATRIIALIEERHPDYFCASSKTKGTDHD